MSDDVFRRAFAYVVSPLTEGGLSLDPKDKGNWTGGQVGVGELKGSNGGISAAAYPNEDIVHLNRVRQMYLYHRDYWQKAHCDALPEALAFVAFDTAVLQGPETAIRILQRSLGIPVDGIFGPQTHDAAWLSKPMDATAAYTMSRIFQLIDDPNFARYGHDWVRRAIRTAMEAMQ